ncbi:MAG: flagellar protein FlaG, partial [Syntrophomonas sp.]
MKVAGQGIAADYGPVKSEAGKQQVANEAITKEQPTKLGVEHLKQVKRISEEDLQNAANVMNEAMKISNYHLQFKVHKDSGR